MHIGPRRDFEGMAQAQLTALAEAWLSITAFRDDLAAAAYGPGPLLFLTGKPLGALGRLWRPRNAQDVVPRDNLLEDGVSELADRALPPYRQAALRHRRAGGIASTIRTPEWSCGPPSVSRNSCRTGSASRHQPAARRSLTERHRRVIWEV
jgi:hypothetical protein